MKKNVGITIAIAIGLSALLLTIASLAGWVQAKSFALSVRGPAPAVISYQGQLFDGTAPFSGKGYFKFQVLSADGFTQYWSNDGIDPPDASITLEVVNGLFSVNLGDTNIPGMSVAIDANTFSEPNALLRVWFSEDEFGEFTPFPDQVIASVPYALQAQNAVSADTAGEAASAGNADTLDTYHSSAFQKDITGSCGAGMAIKEVWDNGGVTCAEIPQLPFFSISEVYQTGGEVVEMAIGSDGLGVIAYQEYLGMTASRLVIIHCADTNCTSRDSQVEIANNLAPEPRQISLVIGPNGYPMLAYTTYQGDLKIANCADVACVQPITFATLDSGSDTYRYPSLALFSGDRGLVSYVNDTNDRLMMATCFNSPCTGFSSDLTIVDMNIGGLAIMDTEIVIGDPVGRPYIAYSLQSGPAAYTIKVYSVDAGLGVPIETAATSPGIDLTVTPGFTPLIAFQKGGLFLYYCWTSDCGENDLNLIDDDAIGGASIALGTDGLPLISYVAMYDQLKVARCNDPYCGVSYKYVLDDQNLPQDDTAIAIGMDGLPLIGYFGSIRDTEDMLVALHCSNRYCNE